MLDLHRLRVFRSVVASGSLTGAAANLGYTPSAVSQHVSALSREVGLQLLERHGRGVRPTTAGLAIAAQADDLLERMHSVESVVADLRAGRTGSVSLTYFPSIGAAWLPEVVRRITEDLPSIGLDLRLADDAWDALDEDADIQVVVNRRDWTPPAGCTAHHLLDDPYVVVAHRSSPLAARSEVELADLVGERWIDNDFARGRCRQTLLDACRAAGFSPAFHVEAHDYPMAIAFVDAGIGITVLPALGATHLPPQVVAVPVVRPTPVRSIFAVVRNGVLDTPAVRRAVEALRRVSAGEPEAA